MALPIPRGIAIIIEPRVTSSVPIMRGNAPYFGMKAVGSHRNPVRILRIPISKKAGTASNNKNPRRKKMAITEKKAQKNQIFLIP